MRAIIFLFLIAAAMSLLTAPRADAATDTSASNVATRVATEMSAQQRRRPRVRIYRSIDERGVFPQYFPGSNAVRDCTVNYVQEFRPSGTVIVPNMKCAWRQP